VYDRYIGNSLQTEAAGEEGHATLAKPEPSSPFGGRETVVRRLQAGMIHDSFQRNSRSGSESRVDVDRGRNRDSMEQEFWLIIPLVSIPVHRCARLLNER
jgi:hypothetical protein